MTSKNIDLQKRIDELEEQLRKRGEGKTRMSKYFVVLNSNTRVSAIESEADLNRKLSYIITYMADHLGNVIIFNKDKHGWSKKYIKKVIVKYAIERGEGRRKKDGTYPENGGFVHSHVTVTIQHTSNITMSYEKLRELLEPLFLEYFGKKGFIGKPRLVSTDQTELYMTKSKPYKKGYRWVTIVRE